MVLSFRVSWSSFLFYGLAKFKGLHDYALIGIKNIKKHGCILTLYYYARAYWS